MDHAPKGTLEGLYQNAPNARDPLTFPLGVVSSGVLAIDLEKTKSEQGRSSESSAV